jgi:uncharacterized protein
MGLVSFSLPSPILVDASFLVSVYDRRELNHRRSMAALALVDQSLVTCEPVVTEATYLLRKIPGATQALLESIEQGFLGVPFVMAKAARQVGELMVKYADMPCDFADACLITMADQLNTGDILTLDSHFKHYRWRRNRKFNLLIPLN